MARVRAGCATWHFSAARVKLSASQRVRKYLIWCISIATILGAANERWSTAWAAARANGGAPRTRQEGGRVRRRMLGPLQCPASIDAIDDRHWLARFRHAQTRTERGIAPYHSEESRRRQYDRDIRTAAMTPCARARQR